MKINHKFNFFGKQTRDPSKQALYLNYQNINAQRARIALQTYN